MKVLYTANDAISRGAYESGVKVVTGYPGTPCTEILTNIHAQYPEVYAEWSVNEKVALEVAMGSSFAGYRSLCVMKTVGLNVAHDALMSAAQSQINGGLVIAIGDDTGRITDDYNDGRLYGDSANVPVLEPSDAQDALELTRIAFNISEYYSLPVIIRLTTIACKTLSPVTINSDYTYCEKIRKKHEVSAYSVYSTTMTLGLKNNTNPLVSQFYHDHFENMTKLSDDIASNHKINTLKLKSKDIGVICSGVSSTVIKEVCPEASILQLRIVNPLPLDLIREMFHEVSDVYIIEDGQEYIEKKIRALGFKNKEFDKSGPFKPIYTPEYIKSKLLKEEASTTKLPGIPFRLPMNCAGCSHLFVYHILKKNNIDATTDVTCGGLGIMPHINAFNNAKNMGASISVAHGYNIAVNDHRYVSVIGDGGFWATGHNGLLNMSFHQGNSTVIIVDNSCIAMTGGQETPESKPRNANPLSISNMCKAYGIEDVNIVDPYNVKLLEETILRCIHSNQISVVIAKKPCLVKFKQTPEYKSQINPALCNQCGTCLSLSCPAITKGENNIYVNIDPDLCVGCNLCKENCKSGAISNEKY